MYTGLFVAMIIIAVLILLPYVIYPPRLKVGQIVRFGPSAVLDGSYLNITKRRWFAESRRWTYSGIVLKIENDDLVWSTFGYNIDQELLVPIPLR